MSPTLYEQATDGFDNIVEGATGGRADAGDLADEAEAVADPTRSASGPTELLVRSNPFTGLPALQMDAQALVQQATGDDREPVTPGATSPLFGSRDASDAVDESGLGKSGDTAADAGGTVIDGIAGAAEDAWNAATPKLPINFQQGVLIILVFIGIIGLGQLFDIGIGGSTA